MIDSKIKIADYFRDQILCKKGKLTESDIQEIIRTFETTYPKRAGKQYWYNYSKHILKTWERNGVHPEELKNLMISLGYDEEIAQSGPPDEGLRIKSKNEKDFTERFVAPYLEEKEGHTIMECNANRRDYFNADIVSEKNGVTYYTEVKKDLGSHRLQTAIGQMLFEIFDNKNNEGEVRYQIAIPEQYKGNRHFLYGFEQYLYETLKITVIYVKG